ncbi:MAG: hypothetical protein JO360_01060 [Acidobacteria bacterium]|nr:hypothetical protein [Acidobacteriota bacterium]
MLRHIIYSLAFIFVMQATLRAQECHVVVQSEAEVANAGVPVIFTANAGCSEPIGKAEYQWVVSAGTITSGQGTHQITVDTAGLFLQEVTATVELKEPGAKSYGTATATVTIGGCGLSRKFDQYGELSFNDEKARLDNFAIELQNNPGAQGYIIAYGGRRGHHGEVDARLERIRNYLLNRRGLAPEFTVTLDGGYREEFTIELYIVPRGFDTPTPTPTVSPNEVEKSNETTDVL